MFHRSMPNDLRVRVFLWTQSNFNVEIKKRLNFNDFL